MKQKYLGARSFICVLALLSSFPPLSTDLYLPALPQMVTAFGTTQAKLNLTLSMFFIFYAFSILIWGPLSEKYGRKPVLFVGLFIYTLSSVICALAIDVNHLILSRALQAIGGGAATAVSTAIVKDVFSGPKREHVLAMVMSLVVAAPVVAPLVGSTLLAFTSWRAIFWVLAGMGILGLLAAFLLEEPLVHRYEGSPLKSLGRLFVVLKNPGFSSLLFIFSIISIPVMAYVSASAYIYIETFRLSEQAFGVLFAINALCATMGPFAYVRLSRKLPSQTIIMGAFILLTFCGLAMIWVGHRHYITFVLTMAPATLCIMSMRPPSVNLMLEQQEFDSGSASALISCSNMIMGSLGIFLVSEASDSLIHILGSLNFAIGILGGMLWLAVRNKSFIHQVQQ